MKVYIKINSWNRRGSTRKLLPMLRKLPQIFFFGGVTWLLSMLSWQVLTNSLVSQVLKWTHKRVLVFFGNVPHNVVIDIIAATGFNREFFPVTYLGLPIITTRLKARDCLPIVLKICAKFETRTCHFLSYAGRLQLN